MVRFLALLVTLSLFPSAQGIKIGAITYWNDASAYNTLPANSFAIINPDDGIIKASSADVKKFGNIISTIKSTIPSVTLFGYVPTGYGDRNKQPYATIKAQVKAYFGNYSKLDGIFYDETDGGCAGTKNDLPQFRKFVQDIKKNGLITYNPGWVGSNWCYLNYSQSGEIVMDFESPYKNYNKSASDLKEAKTIAKSRGIRVLYVLPVIFSLLPICHVDIQLQNGIGSPGLVTSLDGCPPSA